jgi:hypothetical protein
MNDERRVTLFFSPACPSLPFHDWHLPFASGLFFW